MILFALLWYFPMFAFAYFQPNKHSDKKTEQRQSDAPD
jgi:hypothetical protein